VTLVILFVLAAVWAVYLISWVRSRTEHRRVNSIHSFSNHLSILDKAVSDDASSPVAPRVQPLVGGHYFSPKRQSLSPQKKRRRDILFGLSGATAFFFLATLMFGSATVMMLFLLSASALGGYVYLLVQHRKQAEERKTKVRSFPVVETAPAPQAEQIDVMDIVLGDQERHLRVVGGN